MTVTGVNDTADDGDVVYTIVTAAATSTDGTYNGVNASDVTTTNTDDEVTADLGITNTNGVSAVTAGGGTTYTIVVINAGPARVAGATVTDTAPANVTFGTWTCAAVRRVDVSRLRDGRHHGKRGPRCRWHGDVHRPGRRFHRRPAAR